MKQKMIRKAAVYAASLLLVAAAVAGFAAWKSAGEQPEPETAYVNPLPVMTQEEMEELYDRHKTEPGERETLERENEGMEDAAEEETISRTYEGCPVDFEGLWKVNPDVYAWITIPGTVIDYPILQHATDNTYYLNYNIDGSYGYPGCIYTENLNTKEFTDNNTVIYGHNMKNGTMFAGLHKFEEEAFFKDHDRVLIYTPEKELGYTIFAAYVYDDRHLLYSFDFTDSSVYGTYLEDVKNMRSLNALYREGVEVTPEDKIITLVTCMGNQPEKRLLVQAVLDRE